MKKYLQPFFKTGSPYTEGLVKDGYLLVMADSKENAIKFMKGRGIYVRTDHRSSVTHYRKTFNTPKRTYSDTYPDIGYGEYIFKRIDR